MTKAKPKPKEPVKEPVVEITGHTDGTAVLLYRPEAIRALEPDTLHQLMFNLKACISALDTVPTEDAKDAG